MIIKKKLQQGAVLIKQHLRGTLSRLFSGSAVA